MKRVCLITPLHLSANPRLVKQANALIEAGYEIVVVSGHSSADWSKLDSCMFHRNWHETNIVRYGPQVNIIRRLRQKALRYTASIVARTVASPSLRALELAEHDSSADLMAALRRIPADIYIAHMIASLGPAQRAAKRFGAHLAVDAEDFETGILPDLPINLRALSRIKRLEAEYLPLCSFMIAASPGIADAYVEAYGIPRPTVVLNAFPRCHSPEGPTLSGAVQPGPSAYWFSQTIGPDRGIECAVRAIGRAKSGPHLYLRGRPASGFLDRLRRVASEADVSDRLHVLPLESPMKLERLAAPYDVGLSLEPGLTRNSRLTLGNKLFSYLIAGIPIVASDIQSHVAFAAGLGEAITLYRKQDPDNLAAALDALLTDQRRLASARAEAFRLGQQRFNWEIESQVFVRCVDRALARPAR